MTKPITVAALYQFKSLPGYKNLKDLLYNLCEAQGIRGTLLLALEGINGTVAGSYEAIQILKAYLEKSGFDDLNYKESYCETIPFIRLKVRLKKEIVTMGIPSINPLKKVGHYVDPQAWNALIKEPDVIVLDTRNTYEINIGTFQGAMDPKTTCFTQFPQFVRDNLSHLKDKKFALLCTGGIRCEKASSFMLEEGFQEVYHLKGGILKYLETVPVQESLWQGECFVFDQRVAVDHTIEKGGYGLCFGCRYPITEVDKQSAFYEEGVSCPQCFSKKSDKSKAKARLRHRQHLQIKHANLHAKAS